MRLVTIQASAIKSTFEVLKDILNDVNIYFRPQGMYIVTLDTARTSLIDMFYRLTILKNITVNKRKSSLELTFQILSNY